MKTISRNTQPLPPFGPDAITRQLQQEALADKRKAEADARNAAKAAAAEAKASKEAQIVSAA